MPELPVMTAKPAIHAFLSAFRHFVVCRAAIL
jgi:hypothetical protein